MSALSLFVSGDKKEEVLLAALASMCSRVFMPRCDTETEVRSAELFLQCYALLSQGGSAEALREAMYYDLFDYAEEDVRQRFSAPGAGGYSLSMTLPGETLWYADRFPALAAARAEDFSLFLDKALRDRLRPLIRETASEAERKICFDAVDRYLKQRGTDTRFTSRQQGLLRAIYAAEIE